MLWMLFILWLVFTLLDLIISGLALRFGGVHEVGLLFVISQDFQVAAFIKGVASFLFGMILVAYKQKGLLSISCAVYLLLCVWNGWVLYQAVK